MHIAFVYRDHREKRELFKIDTVKSEIAFIPAGTEFERKFLSHVTEVTLKS